MKETAKHLEAYEYFFSLGDRRSLQRVTDKFTVSRVSVSKWCKLFDWRRKVEKRDKKIADKVSEKTDKAMVKYKETYIEFSEDLVEDAIRQFKGEPEVFECTECKKENIITRPRLRCHSIFDVERAIKLHLLLVGEPTEITEVQIEARISLLMAVLVSKAGKYMNPKDLDSFAGDLEEGMEVKNGN